MREIESSPFPNTAVVNLCVTGAALCQLLLVKDLRRELGAIFAPSRYTAKLHFKATELLFHSAMKKQCLYI